MKQTFRDHLGDLIEIDYPPKRIISLVPSITELICYLKSANQKLLGRTKFCVHPKEQLNDVTDIGGTKNLHFDRIRELNSDLIIGNKEENTPKDIYTLKREFPVWMSDVNTVDASFQLIEDIGELLFSNEKAFGLVQSLKAQKKSWKVFNGQSVLYLIWKKPYMGVGSNAFIHDILLQCGLNNCLEREVRYPELTENQIIKLNPDFIFLSSEPFPFKEKDAHYFQNLMPNSKVIIANGELFSWYGSRLLQLKSYLDTLKLLLKSR